MPGLNAHNLLKGTATNNGFLSNITLGDKLLGDLREARDEIRATLKTAFSDWESHLSRNVLFEAGFSGEISQETLKPKFRMQGSMAYHTLNEPAQMPPQQVDVDDGLFLPVSFYNRNGDTSPIVAMQGVFRLVESALQPLCDKNGWQLKQKDTCVRVELDRNSHVDIAIYAISDSEFTSMVEALNRANPDAVKQLQESTDLYADFYERLDGDHIMLAHRKEGWKPSDPRKLENWFKDAVAKYGQQIRRVSRYLKAWRDEQWDNCKLSSIALMKCVVDVYSEGNQPDKERDDLAIQRIAEALPGLLSKQIDNPVVPGQYLDESWDYVERQSFITAASKLEDWVNRALSSDEAGKLIEYFQHSFGNRIPSDCSLVKTPGAVSSNHLSGIAASPEIDRAVQKHKGDRYA